MNAHVIHMKTHEGVELYFCLDEGFLYRLSPSAYNEKYLLLGADSSIKSLHHVHLFNWGEAPASLIRLNRKMANCNNISSSAENIAEFNECEKFFIDLADRPLDIISLKVSGDVQEFFIRTYSYITRRIGDDFFCGPYSKFHVPTQDFEYPCYPVVPLGLLALTHLDPELGTDDKKAYDTYYYVWFNVPIVNGPTKKEVYMNDTIKPNIPYKAIQLFDTIDETNSYDRDVFVYSSSGIKRMSFSEYLHTVEAAHSGDYKMVKVWRTALSEVDQANFDAMKKSTYNGQSGNRLGTIYMCFRSLWYAATKELMSTTAWEESK